MHLTFFPEICQTKNYECKYFVKVWISKEKLPERKMEHINCLNQDFQDKWISEVLSELRMTRTSRITRL